MKKDLANAVAGMNEVHFWDQIRTVGQSLGPFRLDLSLPFQQLLPRVVLRQGGGEGSTFPWRKLPSHANSTKLQSQPFCPDTEPSVLLPADPPCPCPASFPIALTSPCSHMAFPTTVVSTWPVSFSQK